MSCDWPRTSEAAPVQQRDTRIPELLSMPDLKVRAFVAVRPPADLRRACAGVAAAGRGLAMRWVPPESLHLTLKFLGKVSADAIPAIRQALQQAANDAAPFKISLRGLGCFPHAGHPRVVWIGLDDSGLELLQLQSRIELAMTGLRIPAEDRPFRPHLTLARARRTQLVGDLEPLLKEFRNHTFGHFVVSQFHLMRSELNAEGAVHTRLHTVALRGPGTSRAYRVKR